MKSPPQPPTLTLRDVARAAGVSKMTVSNVVNGRAGVRPATRARVEAAILESGYRVNPLARMLAGGERGLVGVLAPSLTWPYVGEVVQGVSEAAEAAGQGLLLLTAPLGRPLDEPRRALLRHLTLGAVLVLPGPDGGPPELAAHSVSVDGPGPHRLLVDHRQGAALAMAHLLELGHRRIAHLAGPAEVGRDHAAQRLAGYRAALRAAGLAPRAAYLGHGDYTEASGHALTRRLLALPEPPSAIFAANDSMAVGAIHAAQDLGLTVPRDLSVVGFDDLPAASALRPALTTVRQPLRRLGADALQALLRAAVGERVPARQTYTTTLVVRESTAPPPT